MATLNEALANAWGAFRNGDYAQAERIYREILRHDPDNADVWCALGVVCRAGGAVGEAVDCQRRALQLRPDFLEALNNLGNALLSRGSFAEAMDAYQRALRLRPDYPEALNNLGAAQRQLGRLDEAIASCRHALRLRPDYADALCNLGDALFAKGEHDQAIAHHRQALRLNPNMPVAHTNLGCALLGVGKLDEAVAHLREALRLRPDYPEAYTNLGHALGAQRKLDEALACQREAIRLKPDFAEGYYNQGIALAELGRLDEALDSYRQALRLRPDYAEALENIGSTLLNQGRPDEALASFERALAIAPEAPSVRLARAVVWLLLGDYERGWPEYEWRWKCKEFTPPPFAQPTWDGSPLDGRTILLHAEQGLGDTLHMIRYAPLVKGRGGTVIVNAPAALHPLLARCPGIDRLVAPGSALPAFDVHASLLSLPSLFGTTVATIPAPDRYLTADPGLVARWRGELERYEGLRIGIAWQGNPRQGSDRQRSFPLAHFEALARVPGVHLFSLQKGPGSEQLQGLSGRFPVVDLGSTLDEAAGAFMDTAAVMMNLDLVIGADTSLVHLAGALGVPVWVALAYAADWRWLRHREDSPWYPSARLFRQSRPGDWPEVFGRMADALRSMPRKSAEGRPILVEIGAGELIDKITILEIKAARFTDATKLGHVRKELDLLAAARDRTLTPSEGLSRLTAELKAVNESLWEVEDQIRLCERDGDFGPRFVELARSVYRQNDRRAALKRQINERLGSRLVEEKGFTADR
jgi:tetratricopeptide (TPR) repeat protein